ncbi:MAG: O-antigen/teichoic acid export membrane protein [Paracoccaceae bacterium]|jgi:O-antigen/teichoic acid export membrane protein
MYRLIQAFRGNRLLARLLRSSSLLLAGYGASQVLRLASNLILTRILFPEAFGLMALVSVITIGLTMFSDVGIGSSISQNKRGDDPDFLNTAWTAQVIRGLMLWGIACLLAWPFAQFYNEPVLALYLPVAGISLVLSGLNPTRIETAHRHLLVGRVTMLELISQVIGITFMVILTWLTGSVLALVLGGVVQSAVKLVLTHLFLPGMRNSFRWEKAAAQELVHYGKWVMMSTAFWFVSVQGDRAILGKYLSLDALGLYNIGYFLASAPIMLGFAVTHRVLIPVYRDKPAGASAENKTKLNHLRMAISSAVIGMLLLMSFIGPELVDFLYDTRYQLSGVMVTLIACSMIPVAIGMTYDQAAMATGDSRSQFIYSAIRAILLVIFVVWGVSQLGLVGAIIGSASAMVLAHPVLIWLALKHHVWDPKHDIGFALISLIFGGAAIWLHWDAVVLMVAQTGP